GFFSSVAHSQDWQFIFDARGNLVVQIAAINATPQIIGQPQKQVVRPGEPASFSVIAADPSGVNYQWFFNGTIIPGATAEALLLTSASAPNEGLYSVVLANSSGSVTSAPAALLI